MTKDVVKPQCLEVQYIKGKSWKIYNKHEIFKSESRELCFRTHEDFIAISDSLHDREQLTSLLQPTSLLKQTVKCDLCWEFEKVGAAA